MEWLKPGDFPEHEAEVHGCKEDHAGDSASGCAMLMELGLTKC